jgi:hypothetical protein
MSEDDTTMTPATTHDAIVRALAEPSFYPHRPARVEHVQTHISHVFLAGSYVYKLKKAVRFPFLDFSTLERRRYFCAEELRLNRRLSPAVYLDVVAVVRTADGGFALGGDGELAEPVLRMRRLPADRMLPALLARDAVDAGMIARLARLLADFHQRAPTGPEITGHAAPQALRSRWDDTMRTLLPFVGTVLRAEEHALLADFGPRFVQRHEPLLRARQDGGHIRDGHGDLHAEHVCFVDDSIVAAADGSALAPGIYIFDCIEFSVAFRCNDVASEIAFLTMDLEHRGRRDLADAFAAAYMVAAADPTIASLLPFYAAARAGVRATVACLTSAEDEIAPPERIAAVAAARAYLALAVRCAWRAGGPAVVVCSGLSGTGKSTLAAALADATDAVLLRSDVIRQRDDSSGRTPVSDRYTAGARAATYETLAREADAVLAGGRGVIADATFIRRADRERLRRVAARHRRPCVFVETRAAEAVVRERLAARTAAEVSEARWDTYVSQRQACEAFGVDEARIVVDTDGAPSVARAAALRQLWAWRCSGG